MQQGSNNMDTSLRMQLWTEFRVGAVKNSVADVSQTFYRLKTDMVAPGAKIAFDSDDPKSDPGMLAQLKDIVGKTFKMHIDDRGRVSDVQLPDGAGEDLAKALGGGDLEKFFGQYVPQLPEAGVAVGGTWDVTTEMNMGPMGKSRLTVHNKLTKADNGRAAVDQTIDVALDQGKLPLQLQVKSAKGSAEIDLAAFVTASNLELQMTGSAERADAKMTADMVVTMAMRTVPPPAKPAGDKK
jgi:hypothetical protein